MKIDINKFRVAVKGTFGYKARICKNLGCSKRGLDLFIERNPEALDLIEEEENRLLDKAEINLEKGLDKGEWEPTKFVLTHKGYKRGYTNRPELVMQQQNVINNTVQVNNNPTYTFEIISPNENNTHKVESKPETTTSV